MAALTPLQRILLIGVAVAVALAGVADLQAWAPIPRFLVAVLALVGVAWIVTFATEQVGEHVGASITGVLQATVANLPELFVILFALRAGDLVIAQTAILGSMLANALLLLGIVIIVGARCSGDGVMRFSKRLPNDAVTLLIVMLFAIVFSSSALKLNGHASGPGDVRTISIVSAACLLAVYGIWLASYLRTEAPAGGTPTLALIPALLLLLASGAGAAFVSDWFVAALKPTIATLGVSKPFAGLVIVAIAGNAVEHASSVVLAARGRFELAVSVVKNSVAQIAGFLFPVMVIVSLALSTQLTFSLAPVYIGALVLMTLAVWQVSGDGQASAFEGWALSALYVIVAVVAALQ